MTTMTFAHHIIQMDRVEQAHAYRRLALACLALACKDAIRRGYVAIEARAWLTSDQAAIYADGNDIDPAGLTSWVIKGCPVSGSIPFSTKF